jgi:Peptidase family M23.
MFFPKRMGIWSIFLGSLTSTVAYAQTCLEKDIMDPAGMVVTSPYGVNRTGRKGASPGYHQGLDMINSKGRGAPIYSGSSGNVEYRNFGGGGIIADVMSGDTRFIYLHMKHSFPASLKKNITAGTQIGTMDCAGMKNCAVHLHLYTAVKGSVLQSSGYNGRTWAWFGAGSKSQHPMTADAIKRAVPNTWYLVNPESYLPRQIPIRNTYPDMPGGVRNTTLPKTCSPGNNEAPTTDLLSMSDATSKTEAVSGALSTAGQSDFAIKIANMPKRSIYIEMAKQSAAELILNSDYTDAPLASALSQLLIVKGVGE